MALDNQQNLRILKWTEMLDNFEYYKTIKYSKLKERVRKGIPEGMRGLAWIKIAGLKEFKAGKENIYKTLLSKINNPNFIDQKEEDVIIRDLHRTFPKNMLFNTKLGDGQRSLFKILMCFGALNRDTGYVQGMGFLAAFFLTYMNEENSFWMLLCIFKKYKLEEVYLKDFPGLKKRFYIFLKLVEKYMPNIYKKLNKYQAYPTMYASQWFFTLFTNCLPFEVIARIFDCYLLEGEKIIFRVALAILKLNENALLNAKGFESFMSELRLCPSKIKNAEVLLKTAFSFSLSRNHINNHEQNYAKLLLNNKEELQKLLGY
jgi:hypothetical protein